MSLSPTGSTQAAAPQAPGYTEQDASITTFVSDLSQRYTHNHSSNEQVKNMETNETTKQQNLADFAKAESKVLEEEKAKTMKDKGLTDFYKIAEGAHTMTFLDVPAKPNPIYKDRVMFQILDKDAKEWTLSINKASPLYRDVIDVLASGKLKIEVVRVGKTQKDTRYSVKAI